MAGDGGFNYSELRDTPLPELYLIEEDVNKILERRKQAIRKARGKG